MYDGELSDKDLEVLSKSDYKYLVNMAKDINDYRGKVEKLSAKDKDFEKSYKSLLEEGKSLNKKYATVKFEDIIGVKKEDVLAYYDRIDELNIKPVMDKYIENGGIYDICVINDTIPPTDVGMICDFENILSVKGRDKGFVQFIQYIM